MSTRNRLLYEIKEVKKSNSICLHKKGSLAAMYSNIYFKAGATFFNDCKFDLVQVHVAFTVLVLQ